MKLKSILMGAAFVAALTPMAANAGRGSDGHVNIFY
jgi:hypothetical protein